MKKPPKLEMRLGSGIEIKLRSGILWSWNSGLNTSLRTSIIDSKSIAILWKKYEEKMTITIHAHTAKNIKLIEKILVTGNFSFEEKDEIAKDSDISAQEFRSMIKARRPSLLGKSLQNL